MEVTAVGRVTLADVSRHVGLSRSAVSLVVNDSPNIPESTKNRVRQAMAELGYVYNRQAAMLRNPRSMALGLIVTEVRNAYFGELVMAVEEAAYQVGYTVLICYSRDQADRQEIQLRRLLERGIDGLVIQPASDTTAEQIETWRRTAGVPTVLLARHFGLPHDYVGADNRRAGELVGRHLASIGARSVAMVGGPTATSTSTERRAGLEVALTAAGVPLSPAEQIPSPTNAAGGAAATAALLDRGDLPDAIVAYSDAIATGLYAELHKRGLRPGRDVGIASFDDLPESEHLVPPLTSAATFPTDIGAASAKLLLERLDDPADGGEVAHVLIEPRLRIRASTVLWRGEHT
jgi:LacI family transcriptional regulator